MKKRRIWISIATVVILLVASAWFAWHSGISYSGRVERMNQSRLQELKQYTGMDFSAATNFHVKYRYKWGWLDAFCFFRLEGDRDQIDKVMQASGFTTTPVDVNDPDLPATLGMVWGGIEPGFPDQGWWYPKQFAAESVGERQPEYCTAACGTTDKGDYAAFVFLWL